VDQILDLFHQQERRGNAADPRVLFGTAVVFVLAVLFRWKYVLLFLFASRDDDRASVYQWGGTSDIVVDRNMMLFIADDRDRHRPHLLHLHPGTEPRAARRLTTTIPVEILFAAGRGSRRPEQRVHTRRTSPRSTSGSRRRTGSRETAAAGSRGSTAWFAGTISARSSRHAGGLQLHPGADGGAAVPRVSVVPFAFPFDRDPDLLSRELAKMAARFGRRSPRGSGGRSAWTASAGSPTRSTA